MEATNRQLIVDEENALKIHEWMTTRGGVTQWDDQNIPSSGQSFTTPLHDVYGVRTRPPGWRYTDSSRKDFTDPSEVVVLVAKLCDSFTVEYKKNMNRPELRRFSKDRIQKASLTASMQNDNKPSFWQFEEIPSRFNTATCNVYVEDRLVLILEWKKERDVKESLEKIYHGTETKIEAPAT